MIIRENLSERKRIRTETLDAFKVFNRDGIVEFNYFNTLGHQGRTRLRTALRGADGSMWAVDDSRVVVEYGNSCLLIQDKDFAFIVEGESDCWVLYEYGYIGIGIPGSNNANCLVGTDLNRFKSLYLIQENNNNGNTYPDGTGIFVNELATVLRNTGYKNTIAIAKLPEEFEDISSIHLQSDNFDRIINEVILKAQTL